VKVYLDAAPTNARDAARTIPAHTGVPSAVSDVQSMLVAARRAGSHAHRVAVVRPPADAIVIDTTGKNIDEVVREVMA
jgi:cytidylate kinase